MKRTVLAGVICLALFVSLLLIASSSDDTDALRTPTTEPGPGLSTHTKSNPHMSVPVVEGDKKERVFSIEEIVSPIPPNSSKVDPLELKWIFSELFDNFSQLYVTVHKGKGRPDRLALYFCENGKYQPLKIIEADGIHSSFAKPNFFHYDFDSTTRKTFIHVPMRYHGTGGFRRDRIFRFESGLTVTAEEVDFEPASEPLSAYLHEGERPSSYAYYDFADNSLKFTFFVFKDIDHHKRPTGGRVSGTYKITKKRKSQVIIEKGDDIPFIRVSFVHPVQYEMKVDTFRREAIVRDRFGFAVDGQSACDPTEVAPQPATQPVELGQRQVFPESIFVRAFERGNSLVIARILSVHSTKDTKPGKFYFYKTKVIRPIILGDLTESDLEKPVELFAGSSFGDALVPGSVYALFITKGLPNYLDWGFRNDVIKLESLDVDHLQALQEAAIKAYKKTAIRQFRESKLKEASSLPNLPEEISAICEQFRANPQNRVEFAKKLYASDMGSRRDLSEPFSSRITYLPPKIILSRGQILSLLGKPTLKCGWSYRWLCGEDKSISDPERYIAVLSVAFNENNETARLLYSPYDKPTSLRLDETRGEAILSKTPNQS